MNFNKQMFKCGKGIKIIKNTFKCVSEFSFENIRNNRKTIQKRKKTKHIRKIKKII